MINSKKGIDKKWVMTVEFTLPNFLTNKGRINEAIPMEKAPAENINPIWPDVAPKLCEKYTLK
jgi:hypothetical protein